MPAHKKKQKKNRDVQQLQAQPLKFWYFWKMHPPPPKLLILKVPHPWGKFLRCKRGFIKHTLTHTHTHSDLTAGSPGQRSASVM